MRSNFLGRSRIVIFFVALFGLILVGKLFYVQVVHGRVYAETADRQYATPSSNIYERGTIYFESKDGQAVRAATQTSGFKIAIDTNKIADPEATYQKLSTVASLDHEGFLAKAAKKNDPYEEVANRLTQTEADAVAALKLPGVSIFKEKWRFYPGGNLASQVLGFVGYKGDALGGRYGLERQYDGVLARNVDNPYINFFAEVFSDIRKTLFENKQPEGDIVTTIEPKVQDFLEKKLTEVKDRYQVDSIGGIIMNPKDGSIYAMSAKPDFDPNKFGEVKDISLFADPLIESRFEFGSVVKPLVMASALDAGVVTPETSYNDTGSVMVEKKQIFNFDKKGRGPGTTMQDVLNQSLNTGMVFVFHKLGKQLMHDYMLAYDIDKKTGIDLPNEINGSAENLIENEHNAREIEYANAAFGQGIAMTPIGLIRALSSVVNGGNLPQPHIVRQIKYNDGTWKTPSYPLTPTKISKATSEEITRMLVTVMDKGLHAGLDHFSMGAKTGTAQVADSATGGYYTDRHTHSFFGFFPAYDPEFIVFLYAVNPKGVPYAATTWTTPFVDIAKFLQNYYNVPPDR